MQMITNELVELRDTHLAASPAHRIKVAVVTSFPRDPGCPVGGVEAVSVNLVRALCDIPELDVHVVTTDHAGLKTEESTWLGVTVHRLPHSGKPVLLDAIGAGRRTIQDFLQQLAPNVIHAHDVYGLMVRDLKIPRVFTIHGFIHADTRLAGQRMALLRSWLWRLVETSGWAEQPHIISISPYVREQLAGIARGVIHDIDNPIAPECFQVERREVPGTIFSAAVLTQRKNPLALVEALAQVRRTGVDAKLRLAGRPVEAQYVANLHRRIKQLGLTAHVTFLGSISSDVVREELAAASVFALVSFEEGSPMGIEEAMAVGVPVVTSNRCGMPYMVRNGESGYLVNPNDADDIADKLSALLADPTLRSTMGEKSRSIAQDRFHPSIVAQRTLDVYRQAMPRSVATGSVR